MVRIRQYEEQTSYFAHKQALCDSQSSVYTLGIVDAVEVFSVKCFSLSAHTSPYIYPSQLPLKVLTNVSMRVPVTANRVTCVTLGRDSEQCGGGALPPGLLLVERVFTKN